MTEETTGTHEDAWIEVERMRKEIVYLRASNDELTKVIEELRVRVQTLIRTVEELQ